MSSTDHVPPDWALKRNAALIAVPRCAASTSTSVGSELDGSQLPVASIEPAVSACCEPSVSVYTTSTSRRELVVPLVRLTKNRNDGCSLPMHMCAVMAELPDGTRIER